MPDLASRLPLSNRLIFDSDLAHVGVVRCPPTARDFGEGCSAKCYCFAFPRSAVAIRPSGTRPFIEDANHVSFYNQGQEYSRRQLAPPGDRCEWYGVAPALVRDAVAPFNPRAADSDRLFVRSQAPVPTAVYLQQRIVFRRIVRYAGLKPCATGLKPCATMQHSDIDALSLEESVIELLHAVVQAAYPPARPIRVAGVRAHEIAEGAQAILATQFSSALRLQSLAAALQTSVFHLCRVFRSVHGRSIHRYLLTLRLRHALEGLEGRGVGVAAVAERLGFSHHSHFTATFRREFGAPPSHIRSVLRGESINDHFSAR